MVTRLLVAGVIAVTCGTCKPPVFDPPGNQNIGFLDLVPPGTALDSCHGFMLAELVGVSRPCPGDAACPDGMEPEACVCPTSGGGLLMVRALEWLGGAGLAPETLVAMLPSDRLARGIELYGDGQPVRAYVCVWREAALMPPLATAVSQLCGFGPTEPVPVLGLTYVVSRDSERIYPLGDITTTAPFEPDGRDVAGGTLWQMMDGQSHRASVAQYRQWVADSLARVPSRPSEEQSPPRQPNPSTQKSAGRGPFFCEWSTAP